MHPTAKNRTRRAASATRLRVEAGQALVELAIIVPVILLLLIGTVEVGRYAYISILVGNAARAGAAYGSKDASQATPNNPNVVNAARLDFAGAANANGLNQTDLTVTDFATCGCDINGTISVDTAANCTPSTPPACAGHWVITIHVTAQGSYSGLFSYPGIPNPLAISRTASMRVAN